MKNKMKSFVVIGIGRFGSNLAKTLYSLGNDVLAIDPNEDRINHIQDFVTHAVVGDPKDESVLKAAGVRNFDCAVVALSDDYQSNILVTLMLKEMGLPYVLSKAGSDLQARVLLKVGADKIIFPEKDMGTKVAQGLSTANILDFIDISDDYSIVEIKVPEKWISKSLRQLNVRALYGVNVIAIKSDKKCCDIDISPNPEYPFEKDDIIVVIGSHESIKKITK